MGFDSLAQVMVYVSNPAASARFWTERLGFVLREKVPGPDGTKAYVVSPREGSETSLVLMDREAVARFSPEVSLQVPSLMFRCQNVAEERDRLRREGVTVGEVVDLGGTPTCNFSDPEGNYFGFCE